MRNASAAAQVLTVKSQSDFTLRPNGGRWQLERVQACAPSRQERLSRAAVGRHPPPNAYVRQRIVEVGRAAQGPVSTAIVTESTLIRGVITATNWLRHRTDLHDTCAFATLELGAAYFERATGRSMDRLRSLYSEALGRARPLAARAGAA
jgi:hypothetical protein